MFLLVNSQKVCVWDVPTVKMCFDESTAEKSFLSVGKFYIDFLPVLI